MTKFELFVRGLPSPDAARRFFEQFLERNPSQAAKLQKNEGLFSDVLTVASFSPLFSTTLIQNPNYVAWLDRKRSDSFVRTKEDLLESLARFALTNSQLEPHVLMARFRRRELLRIFLRDIRRLGTIAEITEEVSNLADAILEHAVRLARQEMDNRFGPPFEFDESERKRPSDISVVSLGKLGSKELNYSSDIDLLFIYSADGETGGGSRGSVSNREYFVKFAERVTQLIGKQSGEGAAYRVDMRLRPNGRVGALALSLRETIRYYLKDARSWEQQVLIRSRASAGNATLYKNFFKAVEETVFRPGRNVADALREVYLSKTKIDREHQADTSFDVKLGRGGIREIEFIAQALQLAHGGDDRWLRVPHTLISISRLADRKYLTEDERSNLSSAYDFLRRLEHILQMEHGLQTHSVPRDQTQLHLIAQKMGCSGIGEFEDLLRKHTGKVHASFSRVFNGEAAASESHDENRTQLRGIDNASADAQNTKARNIGGETTAGLPNQAGLLSSASPKFAQFLSSRPWLSEPTDVTADSLSKRDYGAELAYKIGPNADRASVLTKLRHTWSRFLMEIAIADIHELVSLKEIRDRQTSLAEASIKIALNAAAGEIGRRYKTHFHPPAVLALGKLGSGTLDYDSDLDLILVYREQEHIEGGVTLSELHSRTAELFINNLSGLTRDGNLYRVDLRLRPHGKNGPNVTTENALVDYVENGASIWELLAYIQVRGIGTDQAAEMENTVRAAIDRRIACEDRSVIKRETYNMRLRLEHQHGKTHGGRDVNIKFSSGGLLDIYFAVRYLHLLNAGSIDLNSRSTSSKLIAFKNAELLTAEDFAALHDGHTFLSNLDHATRLTIGRSSRFPRANPNALNKIAGRVKVESADNLMQQLSLHRLNIREAFEGLFNE